jgi:hypothetical protein
MFSLVSRKFLAMRNIALYSVYKNLHIEPFNSGIKAFVLIFAQPTWAAQLSEPVEVRALFYPSSTVFDVITL